MMQHEKELNMRAARKKAEAEMIDGTPIKDDYLMVSDCDVAMSDEDGTLQKSVQAGPKDVS